MIICKTAPFGLEKKAKAMRTQCFVFLFVLPLCKKPSSLSFTNLFLCFTRASLPVLAQQSWNPIPLSWHVLHLLCKWSRCTVYVVFPLILSWLHKWASSKLLEMLLLQCHSPRGCLGGWENCVKICPIHFWSLAYPNFYKEFYKECEKDFRSLIENFSSTYT